VKLLDADWSAFVVALESWRRVPVPARRLFLEFVQPSLPFTAEAAAEALPSLLDAKLLVGGQEASSVRVSGELRPFARVMRALYRHPVFDRERPLTLGQYLADHFSFQEREAFGAGSLDRAAAAIGSRAWVAGFLEASATAEWERTRQDARSEPFFATPATGEPARELVSYLLKRRRPVEMRELAADPAFGADGGERFGLVLGGCFRYCLLFPGLRRRDLEPVVGVWPGVLTTRRRRPAPPEAASPERTFHAPLLVHDMAAVLVECASEPLPVRRTDLGLFARTVGELSGLLYPLPAWCDAVLSKTPETRLRTAQLFLHGAGFAAVGRGRELRMSATEEGRRWLGLPMHGKLLAVYRLLQRAPVRPAPDRRLELLPSPPALLLQSGRLDLRAAVAELFRDLEAGRYVEYRSFLRGRCQGANPYLELRRRGVRMSLRGTDGYREPSRAELVEQWERLVERFLAQRLLVLDAVSLGLTAERRLCFSLTDAGRCLLGFAEDFEYGVDDAARIVVQPNFEIVFLAPSSAAEAAIGRFAERVGRDVGTLFRITKKSAIRAAASGLTVPGVLASLRDLASGDLPRNVVAELEGWFGQCRTVRMESALVLRSPDGETTARVAAAAGKLVRVMSDTVLEVVEPRRRTPLARRLLEEGIFLEVIQERRPEKAGRGSR
jgi:hypothetical protein